MAHPKAGTSWSNQTGQTFCDYCDGSDAATPGTGIVAHTPECPIAVGRRLLAQSDPGGGENVIPLDRQERRR